MSPGGAVRSSLWRWGPPILWMAIISLGSTSALAADETGRFIVPLFRWLLPGAAPATLDLLHHAVRKLGHVTEFAVLALLWCRSLAWGTRALQPRTAVAAFGLSVLFAGVDEAHQAFVVTRTASVLDVGWDGLGALCGVVGRSALYGLSSGGTSANAPEDGLPGRLEAARDD